VTVVLLAVRVNSRKHLQVFILLTAKMTNRTSHRGFMPYLIFIHWSTLRD